MNLLNIKLNVESNTTLTFNFVSYRLVHLEKKHLNRYTDDWKFKNLLDIKSKFRDLLQTF